MLRTRRCCLRKANSPALRNSGGTKSGFECSELKGRVQEASRPFEASRARHVAAMLPFQPLDAFYVSHAHTSSLSRSVLSINIAVTTVCSFGCGISRCALAQALSKVLSLVMYAWCDV